MARPKTVTADVEPKTTKKKKSFLDTIRTFDNSAELLSDAQSAVIHDYIDTGNYMLNACMTGSIRKGVPCGKIVTLAGSSGCLQKNETIGIYILKSISDCSNERIDELSETAS